MNTGHFDVAVVGAGPAGLGAAVEAARSGLHVALVDENAAPGGQIWRALPAAFRGGVGAGPAADAREVLAELEEVAVQRYPNTFVWGAFEPRVLEAAGPEGPLRIHARAVIVAAGAYDRPYAVPGWTLPGVLTVGGGQTLLKGQRLVPEGPVVLAGTGPLLLVVAAQLAEAGAEIAAVAELAPASAVWRQAAGVVRAPRLLARGIGYHLALRRRRVRWLTGRRLVEIEGTARVESAVLAAVDAAGRAIAGTEERIPAAMVLVGYGLVSSTELPVALGCRLDWDPARASFVPSRDADLRTSVAGVYAAGDGAGVAGAVVALAEGRLAGITAAADLKAIAPDEARRRQAGPRRRLARLEPFRRAMDAAFPPPGAAIGVSTALTIVCRCEEVRAGDIWAAIEDGAADAARVKLWTRAGMGPCQGRMCHATTVALVAAARGTSGAEAFSVRAPIKPVDVSALVG